MDSLTKLQEWYSLQCDGDWEHEFGVKIENLDNPGWRCKVPLERTLLENIPFQQVDIERSDNDWVICEVIDNTFLAHGGPKNLEEMLSIFFEYAARANKVK